VATTYTGAWKVKAKARTVVPLVSERDPEHLTPTATPEYEDMAPLWMSTVDAPTLPGEVGAQDAEAGTFPMGLGPLDHTPDDPQLGIAGGNGMTLAQAQAQRGAAHSMDYGAVAAHAWNPMRDRDGTPHVDEIPQGPLNGDSPQTLVLERTGLGQPNDPYARPGKRIQRWYDRYIDMHRYPVTYPPKTSKQARTAQVQPPVTDPTQYDSRYPTAATQWMGTQDRFVEPQLRREPVPWQQPGTGDATVDNVTGVSNDYGLGQWGF